MARPPRNTALSNLIGQRLAVLIAESGKSQTETSYDLRVPAAMISRWSSGAQVPSVESVIRICDHFGVSSDWLLGLSTERHHGRVVSRTAAEIVDMTDQLEANERQRQVSRSRRQS